MFNRRLSSQAILFVFVSYLFFATALPSQAATILYDDFSDGSVTDGSPVSWEVSPFVGGGTMDVVGGDLILSPDPTERVVVAIPDLGFLGGVSIKMKVRLLEHSGNFGVNIVYGNDEVNLDHNSYIGLFDQLRFAIGSKFFDDIAHPTDMDPRIEDIVMQFDIFGSTLSAWAWRAGSAPPTEPLITTMDSSVPIGKPGILFSTTREAWVGNDPSPRTLAVRYYQVSDAHIPIPEPLTASAIYEVFDETFDNLGDQVVDVSTASVASVGEVDKTDVNKISRLIAKFNLPDSPTGTLKKATLRFMPVNIVGIPAGPVSVRHSQTDNDMDQLASDFEDPSYNDTSQDLIQSDDVLDFLNPNIYEVDVTSQVLADYATDGLSPMSSFRLQIDESVFFEDDVSHQFRLSMPNGTFSPELFLYFVPEPNTCTLALVSLCLVISRRRIAAR